MPKLPTLSKQYDKNTNTVSYVLTSSNPEIIQNSHSLNLKQSESQTPTKSKTKRIATNALTEYLPSNDKEKEKKDRERELKSFEQSLLKKFGSSKASILKKLNANSLKQKEELSKEIMSYFVRVPKLQRLRHKFNDNDLSKLCLLQKALQISPKQYVKVLKRYPFILKLDIEKEIIPKFRALQQIFPNEDTLSIFIRAPNIIATKTSTWLQRRDKMNNLLGIRQNIFVGALSKQPSILFNSIIKTTSPKIRFLCDRVRSKYELESILIVQPSILKVGWGRLARIEFLRSNSVPSEWQNECINPPPITQNILNDADDSDLDNLNDAPVDKKKEAERVRMRRLKQKEKEMNREWHLNRPCVTWNHHQMKHNYPHYIKFLEEFTLRAKRAKMWTKKDLVSITSKEMEGIVGEALRKKYVRSRTKMGGVDWKKKEEQQRQNKRVKRMKNKMSKLPKVQKTF